MKALVQRDEENVTITQQLLCILVLLSLVCFTALQPSYFDFIFFFLHIFCVVLAQSTLIFYRNKKILTNKMCCAEKIRMSTFILAYSVITAICWFVVCFFLLYEHCSHIHTCTHTYTHWTTWHWKCFVFFRAHSLMNLNVDNELWHRMQTTKINVAVLHEKKNEDDENDEVE